MIIRTKIVATLGPATSSQEVIGRLVRAGCDVMRVNFSHGTWPQHEAVLRTIRAVESELGQPLAVMADLCGPKIRVGPIAGGSIALAQGTTITLTADPVEGTAQQISITLPELMDAAQVGQRLLLDDGKLCLEVSEAGRGRPMVCTVIRGGVLSSGKGVNLPHTQIKLSALTEKDRRDVEWIAGRDFDYVSLSFVRSEQDVQDLRALLEARGCGAHIVAKIEKPQALQRIESIIEAADAIMVARGDLGVEMDLPAVPVVQKRIAHLCQKAGKPCIVATQMLESMIASPQPTRAEVSDVANAVLDYADAVMLSGETAVGKFPVEAVDMMNRIVQEMQGYHDECNNAATVNFAPSRTYAAMAAAVGQVLQHDDIAAVAVFTNSGTTARVLAKTRLCRPILALSQHLATVRRMCLYYGVAAMQHAQAPEHTRDVLDLAARLCLEQGLAQRGQKIVVVTGRPIGQGGCTNTMVVHQV